MTDNGIEDDDDECRSSPVLHAPPLESGIKIKEGAGNR